MAALRHAGVEIDFADFVAASGWRARTPERIERVVPILRRALDSERAGLAMLRSAVRLLVLSDIQRACSAAEKDPLL